MIEIDAAALPPGNPLEADICIIGAGAAGLVMAREFSKASQRVVVLESGIANARCEAARPRAGRVPQGVKRYHDPIVQPLYAGEVAGLLARVDADFALRSRNRCIGGSTNCWDGWLCPLDQADFAPRPGWPTGWPIAYDELVPFYRRALAMCGVPSQAWELFREPDATWPVAATRAVRAHGVDLAQLLLLDSAGELGFDRRFDAHLRAAANLDLVRNANLVALDRCGSRIEAAQVVCLDPLAKRAARRLIVRSDVYVLATGGIENVRLLKLSDLGSGRWCGAGFMCHPMYANALSFVPSGRGACERLSRFFSVRPARGEASYMVRGAIVSSKHGAPAEGDGAFRALVFQDASAGRRSYVSIDWEQRPDPANRIELTGSGDEVLGLPTVRITWNLKPADRRALRVALGRIADVMRSVAGARDVCMLPLEGDEWPLRDLADEPLYPGEHHIGATRMAADPLHGVVDRDCRVFGVDNLFVAGSSVFPTAGHANPTLTILALAIRLADHLTSHTARVSKWAAARLPIAMDNPRR